MLAVFWAWAVPYRNGAVHHDCLAQSTSLLVNQFGQTRCKAQPLAAFCACKDGGIAGTIGADGSAGSFHVRPFESLVQTADPKDGPGNPAWLSGQWAKLHHEWNSIGILRLRGSPALEDDNVVHVLDLNKGQVAREQLRLRVCFDNGPLQGLSQKAEPFKESFWHLAPGEVARLGGPDVDGFVVATFEGLQTLVLDQPIQFSLAPTLEVLCSPEVTEERESDARQLPNEAEKTERATLPLNMPLRFGPPSLFPHALRGCWIRGGMTITISDGFVCQEGDDKEDRFPLQVFPEISYNRWGGWLLNLARSNALVLEWTTKMNADSLLEHKVIRWWRPWVFKGMIEVLEAGSKEVNGFYAPDFTGSSIKYASLERQNYIEQRNDGSWAISCKYEQSPSEGCKVYYTQQCAEVDIGQWDSEGVSSVASLPAPIIRKWLGGERQKHQAAFRVNSGLQIDEISSNVLPRHLCRLPSEQIRGSAMISEGIIEQFCGDAIVIIEADGMAGLRSFLGGAAEVAAVSASDSMPIILPAGQLPASLCACIRLTSAQLNQPTSTAVAQEELQDKMRQAVLDLRAQGAVSIAVRKIAETVDLTSLTPELIVSTTMKSILDGNGKVKKPELQSQGLEIHFLVAAADVPRCRGALEATVAKWSCLAASGCPCTDV